MSFLDKIKNMISIEEDGYYPDDVDTGDFIDRFEETETRPVRPSHRAQRSADQDKVVNIHTTAQLQVVLSKPEKFDEALSIADNLNEKRTVVLNLEAASKEVARRLIDLLNGVAYANGGQLKKVSTNTYIITPYNVNVSGDLIDELESTGVFF
jgi:cell division inhibitor SepF